MLLFHCASLQTAIVKGIPAIGVMIGVKYVKIKNVYQNVILNNVYIVFQQEIIQKYKWKTAVIVKNAIRENVRNLYSLTIMD